MELREAIEEIKKVTVGCDPWTAFDFSDGEYEEVVHVDHAIATILNAVVDGTLIPADEDDDALTVAYLKGVADGKDQAAEKAILDLIIDTPQPEPCDCICHSQPGVTHVVACCDRPPLDAFAGTTGTIQPADAVFQVKEGYEVEAYKRVETERRFSMVRSELSEALAKQRDELAAALEAAEKRISDLTEELNVTTRQGLIYKNERDQALAASAAREIAMRDRAAERIESIGFSAGLIRALPLSPEGQQALNDMLADAWDEGHTVGVVWPEKERNPYRKGAT